MPVVKPDAAKRADLQDQVAAEAAVRTRVGRSGTLINRYTLKPAPCG